MGERCIYGNLSQIYGRWSREKQSAFEKCQALYEKTENSTGFGIGNANTSSFTASWFGTKDGENIMRVETKDNSYLVWLDR